MKKSTLVSSVLGIIGGIILALGMVLALVEQFNLFIPGIVIGVVGLLLLALIYPIYCKMENKVSKPINTKVVGVIIYTTISTLIMGGGMSLVLVFPERLVLGIILGSVGLVMCLGATAMILKLTGHPIKLTKEKTGAIIVGSLGFILVGVGVALCLPNIGEPLMLLGLALGLIGIMICALTPVIYKYKNS